MTGVVLCGGESTRMGTDKGLLEIQSKTWAEVAETKLAALGIPVVISINTKQHEQYSKIFQPEKLIPDQTAIDVKGPLLGLLSLHQILPEEDLIVLACDMIDMKTKLLQQLLAKYNEGKHDAYIYSSGENYQPLCGIYKAGGLKKINEIYQKGSLKRYSMMHVLEILQTEVLSIKEEDVACFNNYNSL
jgi:molybdenum cofactor guanylyltransferase